MTSGPSASARTLLVPRVTGTPGDDLVAWGLAVLASELAEDDVLLVDAGTHLRIELPMPGDRLPQCLDRNGPPVRARLRWLAKPGGEPNPFAPPAGVPSVDRDELRAAFQTARQARGLSQPVAGDAPAVTLTADPRRYPLYAVLTNPGTQWRGYNGLVQCAEQLLTPSGIDLVLRSYDSIEPLTSAQIDQGLRGLGLGRGTDRWRNPPGFLYTGLNKGPTMRLDVGATTVGDPVRPDWLMIDRGDRSVVELFLAYVGYFAVAQVMDDGDGRSVLVPAPARVLVPAALESLRNVRLSGRGPLAYLRANVALEYASAALAYLEHLRERDPEEAAESDLAFHGVHLARYWKPSNNTYAPIRVGLVPLPSWLRPIRRRSFGEAQEVLAYHARRLWQARGRGPERRLTSERRAVLDAYEASLGGDIRAWLVAVAQWWPMVRASQTERSPDAQPVTPWQTEDVRRIAMALQPDLDQILDSGAFLTVTRAIRAATVAAHFARLAARGGGPRSPFDPQYDLLTSLAEAAERHPQEFLRELYRFAARYNDETMRKNNQAAQGSRRLMLQQADLAQVSEWVLADRRGVVPAAIMAFGSSRSGGPGPEAPAADSTDVGDEEQTVIGIDEQADEVEDESR